MREGGGNRAKIEGLRFHLREAETRFYFITYEVKVSRFNLRSKGGGLEAGLSSRGGEVLRRTGT